MRLHYGWALTLGAVAVAACGGDDSKGDADKAADEQDTGSTSNDRDAGMDVNSSTSSGGGSCGKGEYKVGTGDLDLCGVSEADDSCPSIAKLAGYTTVKGDLNIYPGDDKDLSNASCLQTVGSLSLSGGTEITSLKGLGSVKAATGLEVLGMEKLTSLAGIEKLGSVQQLTISGNLLLKDIVGLPKGFKIGSLYVTGNPELTSVDGLGDVQITDVIAFENNPKLSSCKAAAFAKKFPDAELSNFGNLTEQCP